MLESLTRESSHAGRDKKAHRFNGWKTGVKRPSPPGTTQRRPGENPWAVPGGLDSLSHATHGSTTPTRTTPARAGDPVKPWAIIFRARGARVPLVKQWLGARC